MSSFVVTSLSLQECRKTENSGGHVLLFKKASPKIKKKMVFGTILLTFSKNCLLQIVLFLLLPLMNHNPWDQLSDRAGVLGQQTCPQHSLLF